MNRREFMPSKMYELIEPYSKTIPEIVSFGGTLRRGIVLAIGFIMVVSIISICRIPTNAKLSSIGKRTAAILVYSGFVVKIGSKIGFHFFPQLVSIKGEIALIISIPLSILVMMICGNKWSNKLYEFINNTTYKVIVK